MKQQYIIVLIYLFSLHNALAQVNLPIEGLWQVTDYQIMGDPAMDVAEQSSQTGIKTLLITPQSVSTLNSTSDFKEKTLIQALPGYTVKKVTVTHKTRKGKRMKEHFELYRQNRVMLKVYPDSTTKKIARIHVFDNKALAPNQIKLGTTYAEMFKSDEQLIDCQAGIKNRSGQTLCSFEKMSNIQYVFVPSMDKNISPIDALNQAKLVEIVWKAKETLLNLIAR